MRKRKYIYILPGMYIFMKEKFHKYTLFVTAIKAVSTLVLTSITLDCYPNRYLTRTGVCDFKRI